MKNKSSFFEKRSVVATFGVLALLGGFLFLNASVFSGGVTGNAVISGVYNINLVSGIGMLLIICSAILIVYAIVKKS